MQSEEELLQGWLLVEFTDCRGIKTWICSRQICLGWTVHRQQVASGTCKIENERIWGTCLAAVSLDHFLSYQLVSVWWKPSMKYGQWRGNRGRVAVRSELHHSLIPGCSRCQSSHRLESSSLLSHGTSLIPSKLVPNHVGLCAHLRTNLVHAVA